MADISDAPEIKFNPITEGNVPKTLVLFAIPLMFSMLLQVLYAATDLFVIGLYAGPESISAIANGAQWMHIVMGLVMGLSVGGTVLIGFHVGERNDEDAARAVGTMTVLFSAAAIILTPFLAWKTPEFVALARVPEEAVGETIRYIFFCSLGLPFIIGYNVVSAVYRGLGDSKTPLCFVAIACSLNIVLDFVFIGSWELAAKGAAFATVISQAVSFLLALAYMRWKGFGFPVHLRHFRLYGKCVRKILRVGIPLSLQDSLISVSFLIIMVFVNSMGLISSASVGVAGRIIGFCMMPPVAFAGAVATMTAQNMGARQPGRAYASLGYGIGFSLIFGIGTWCFCQLYPELLPGIFTQDPSVRAGAGLYLKSFTLDCILVSFIFSLNSFFSGCGRSFISMIYSLASTFAVRVPAAWWISCLPNATLYHLGFAAPLATLFSILIAIGYFFRLKKELEKKSAGESGPDDDAEEENVRKEVLAPGV